MAAGGAAAVAAGRLVALALDGDGGATLSAHRVRARGPAASGGSWELDISETHGPLPVALDAEGDAPKRVLAAGAVALGRDTVERAAFVVRGRLGVAVVLAPGSGGAGAAFPEVVRVKGARGAQAAQIDAEGNVKLFCGHAALGFRAELDTPARTDVVPAAGLTATELAVELAPGAVLAGQPCQFSCSRHLEVLALTARGEVRWRSTLPGTEGAVDLAVLERDGRRELSVLCEGGIAHLYDAQTGQHLGSLREPGATQQLVLEYDGIEGDLSCLVSPTPGVAGFALAAFSRTKRVRRWHFCPSAPPEKRWDAQAGAADAPPSPAASPGSGNRRKAAREAHSDSGPGTSSRLTGQQEEQAAKMRAVVAEALAGRVEQAQVRAGERRDQIRAKRELVQALREQHAHCFAQPPDHACHADCPGAAGLRKWRESLTLVAEARPEPGRAETSTRKRAAAPPSSLRCELVRAKVVTARRVVWVEVRVEHGTDLLRGDFAVELSCKHAGIRGRSWSTPSQDGQGTLLLAYGELDEAWAMAPTDQALLVHATLFGAAGWAQPIGTVELGAQADAPTHSGAVRASLSGRDELEGAVRAAAAAQALRLGVHCSGTPARAEALRRAMHSEIDALWTASPLWGALSKPGVRLAHLGGDAGSVFVLEATSEESLALVSRKLRALAGKELALTVQPVWGPEWSAALEAAASAMLAELDLAVKGPDGGLAQLAAAQAATDAAAAPLVALGPLFAPLCPRRGLQDGMHAPNG